MSFRRPTSPPTNRGTLSLRYIALGMLLGLAFCVGCVAVGLWSAP